MRQVSDQLLLTTDGQRLYEITDRVRSWVAAQEITAGLLTLYLHHTSASLLIQENADAEVLGDLNDFFCASCSKSCATTPTPRKARTTCRRTSAPRSPPRTCRSR